MSAPRAEESTLRVRPPGRYSLPTKSAVYDGTVTHARHTPVHHAFSYRTFMLLLDLDELPGLFDGIPGWSARGPAPAWFRRADYLGDPDRPLADEVRDLVARRLGLGDGERPRGPVRMLTHLRYFGYCFNPVTFYWCFAEDGETVTHTVAEVTNTPWHERHAYVAAGTRSHHEKVHHVSPFFAMEMDYTLTLPAPGARLAPQIRADAAGARAFDATMLLERREISRPLMARLLLARAPVTAKTTAAIYAQALRIRLKGIRTHPHPRLAA